MALSRWSHSDWYIYDCGDSELGEPEICVCTIGTYTLSEILYDYSKLSKKVSSLGYGILSRIELRLYLTLWAKLESRKIEHDLASALINLLRLAGHIRWYVYEPSTEELSTILRYCERISRYCESKLFPVYYGRKETLRKAAVKEWLASRCIE